MMIDWVKMSRNVFLMQVTADKLDIHLWRCLITDTTENVQKKFQRQTLAMKAVKIPWKHHVERCDVVMDAFH